MLVEEIPKKGTNNGSTIYFSSLVNLQARPTKADGEERQKSRPKVNYNLTELLNAQTQVNYSNGTVSSTSFKSSQQMQLERLISKRLADLGKESPNPNFELPKTFAYTSVHKHTSAADKKKARLGNTPLTKRILAARRALASYYEEEKNLISINTILGVNYAFAEQNTGTAVRPKVKLCCMCGLRSNYSRCGSCGLYSCSVRCLRHHHELRCT